MSDTPIIDTRAPEYENVAGQSPKRDRWTFLRDLKSKIDKRIYGVKPKPEEAPHTAIPDIPITTQKEHPEENTRVEIPVPGTTPIPEGNIRLFHFTYPGLLENIRREGITRKGHEITSDAGLNVAPDSTWVYSDMNLKEPPNWTIGLPYLEFSAPPEDMGPHNAVTKEGTARTLKPEVDISPDRIVAIHEPWHEMVRHSYNNTVDPEWLKTYIDNSVRNAGGRGTRGNYTDYVQMARQQQFLESQLIKANRYLNSSAFSSEKTF